MQQRVMVEVARLAQGVFAVDELGRADRKHLFLEEARRREAGEIARAPADQRVDGAAVERVLDRVAARRRYSAVTLTLAALATVSLLRKGIPKASASISNTSPFSVLTPSENESVAVPK